MNFQKYEQEVKHFLLENYTNLKRVKIANSEFALNELVQTEQADINNYASSITKKMISEARKEFVTATDPENGYELGEKFKSLIKAPVFKKIEVNFSQTNPNQPQPQPKRQATQNVKKNVEKKVLEKNNSAMLAAGAGVATVVVGLPGAMTLTPASFGASLLIVGLSAIVVAGVVYTVINYMDEQGQQQTAYIQPEAVAQFKSSYTKSTNSTTVQSEKTIDQASMAQLLDVRRNEAERVLLQTIQEVKKKYEQFQAQLV